ncbi:hypothetical protein [Clostridium sp.]|uniref:hypothetical protein n=1 Tax=Clostridium sp. TaxID=1506 RepID=UPI001B742D47|nr:hypothetical protein [Clostridium sp.]MBP3917347.1 hypothetical protein [Clostridium sp.]
MISQKKLIPLIIYIFIISCLSAYYIYKYETIEKYTIEATARFYDDSISFDYDDVTRKNLLEKTDAFSVPHYYYFNGNYEATYPKDIEPMSIARVKVELNHFDKSLYINKIELLEEPIPIKFWRN